MEDLKDTLLKLDTDDDSNWTSDGQVRLDVLKKITGQPVTRKDISSTLHGFSRTNQGSPVSEQQEVEAVTKHSSSGNLSIEDANKLLDQATKIESEASAEVRELRRQADVIISKIDSEDSRKTTAHDIQAFQKSQFEQRVKAANAKKRMDEFLAKQV